MNSNKTIAAALAAGLLALLGAAELRAQNGGFVFFGPLRRVITPNGDNVNDRLFLCFDNFSDSGVDARIFTLLGSEVAPMRHIRAANGGCAGGTSPQYATWDGRASGIVVRSGMYVYRVEAEGKSYTGTFLVVR